jgi:hypothetical protein
MLKKEVRKELSMIHLNADEKIFVISVTNIFLQYFTIYSTEKGIFVNESQDVDYGADFTKVVTNI